MLATTGVNGWTATDRRGTLIWWAIEYGGLFVMPLEEAHERRCAARCERIVDDFLCFFDARGAAAAAPAPEAC